MRAAPRALMRSLHPMQRSMWAAAQAPFLLRCTMRTCILSQEHTVIKRLGQVAPPSQAWQAMWLFCRLLL